VVRDVVRGAILKDPSMVLDDRDVITALIGERSNLGRNVVDLRGVLIGGAVAADNHCSSERWD